MAWGAGLEKADRALRMVGMGGEADKLKVGMNHAAEDAVADAKGILTGGERRSMVCSVVLRMRSGRSVKTRWDRRIRSSKRSSRRFTDGPRAPSGVSCGCA